MNILFFIFFISINLILIFKVNDLLNVKIAFTSYGISLVAVPMLMLAGIYLLRFVEFHADIHFQDIYFDVMFSLVVLVLLNLIDISANIMMHKLFQFQEVGNRVDIVRNPTRLLLKNRQRIKVIYRIAFFMGSILMFYGIWLDEK